MSRTGKFLGASALLLLAACSRGSPRSPGEPATARAAAPAAKLVAPTRLLSLPVSAYTPSLALDGETVYLLTRDAAYRLVAGKPPRRTELDLGIGPVLAESGITFWSKGAIWNAAKEGGSVWRVATVPKQPEYFVASSAGIAWLDRADDGAYRLQTLDGQKARVLVAQQGEISAVHMVHDRVFFVTRGKDNSWRIGGVHIAGGEPAYTESRTGPTPAQLAGTESVVYYDMDKSEIRQLTPDLKTEHVWLKDFVCSPIHEANHVFCGRVEGLFEVLADSHTPKPLVFGRHQTITLVRANAKQVVWIADVGPDQLAVEMLPVVP
jgi:hypothetical protein